MTKGVAIAPERPATRAMSFERHLIRTARFAGPVILARAGLLVMVAIDSAMLGPLRHRLPRLLRGGECRAGG